MPFSRRRNRGRLTVRQLVAGGWWLVAGSAYGAGSRIGIGGRGSMGPVPTGATSHQPPRCHFDRSAVEWRNLTAQWSGEISLLNGAGRITVGDISAQSYNRALILFSSYRFRAPLEMTCEAARPGPRSSAEDVACSLFLATSS